MSWFQASGITPVRYTCGHCGRDVGSNRGYHRGAAGTPNIAICPYCEAPTYFPGDGSQHPGLAYGDEVRHAPPDVTALYDEARRCYSVNAFTSVVLACRKLLMAISAAEGAEEGKSFAFYVDWLADNGYVPPKGKDWVDRIRTLGNEATHEVAPKAAADAETLLTFVEMLLKFIWEFPTQAHAPIGP